VGRATTCAGRKADPQHGPRILRRAGVAALFQTVRRQCDNGRRAACAMACGQPCADVRARACHRQTCLTVHGGVAVGTDGVVRVTVVVVMVVAAAVCAGGMWGSEGG